MSVTRVLVRIRKVGPGHYTVEAATPALERRIAAKLAEAALRIGANRIVMSAEPFAEVIQ